MVENSNRYDKIRLGELEAKMTETPENVVETPPESFQKWSEELSEGWAEIVMEDVLTGYQISKLGEVTRPDGELARPSHDGGTLRVNLRRTDGRYRSVQLAKLVLWVFEGGDGTPVYLDGDKKNCRFDNLRWATDEEVPVKSAPAPKKKAKAPAPSGGDQVEVFRVYKYKGLVVEVDSKGKLKLPKVNVTAEQSMALAKIIDKINEQNRFMKLG